MHIIWIVFLLGSILVIHSPSSTSINQTSTMTLQSLFSFKSHSTSNITDYSNEKNISSSINPLPTSNHSLAYYFMKDRSSKWEWENIQIDCLFFFFFRSFVKNSNQNSSHCRVNHQFDYVDYCSISISVSYFEWTHRNMHMCHFRSSPSVSLFDQIDWGKRRRGFCYCRRDSHLFLRQIQTHLSRLDDDQCMEENYPLDSRYTFVSYSFIIHCIDEQCTYFLQERETS